MTIATWSQTNGSVEATNCANYSKRISMFCQRHQIHSEIWPITGKSLSNERFSSPVVSGYSSSNQSSIFPTKEDLFPSLPEYESSLEKILVVFREWKDKPVSVEANQMKTFLRNKLSADNQLTLQWVFSHFLSALIVFFSSLFHLSFSPLFLNQSRLLQHRWRRSRQSRLARGIPGRFQAKSHRKASLLHRTRP